MNQPSLGHAITTAVRISLDARRDRLDAAQLVAQSDALLAARARGHRAPAATTATLLERYDTLLHQELCQGTQPRMTPATVEAAL